MSVFNRRYRENSGEWNRLDRGLTVRSNVNGQQFVLLTPTWLEGITSVAYKRESGLGILGTKPRRSPG